MLGWQIRDVKRADTFYYIQSGVRDATEHILDIALNLTHIFISSTEDTSAYAHRVNVAKVNCSLKRNKNTWNWKWIFIASYTKNVIFRL